MNDHKRLDFKRFIFARARQFKARKFKARKFKARKFKARKFKARKFKADNSRPTMQGRNFMPSFTGNDFLGCVVLAPPEPHHTSRRLRFYHILASLECLA
jgi:hypothetical protein